MGTTRITVDFDNPPELTDEEQAYLERARANPDAPIDTSDIPELDAAFFQREQKKQLTMRLDNDVVEWFKSQGSGYQTRINAVLRAFYERHREQT